MTARPGFNGSAPHSAEAEQSVLGALQQDPDAWLAVAERLQPADFYDDANRSIFSALAGMHREGIEADPVALLERLRAVGKADQCGGIEYLQALANSVPSARNIGAYANVVLEHARRRRLLALADELQHAAADPARRPADVAAGVQDALGKLADKGPGANAPRFRLLTRDELRELPRMEWASRGLLPAHGCAAIYGPSGSGKSFLQVDMVAALAEGRDWFGHRVRRPHRVVCVVLEGEEGFRQRVQAWAIRNGRELPDNVRFVFGPFRINDRDDVLALGAAIDAAGGADIVSIDTLNRAAPGTDENSSRDMSLILTHAKELQGTFGGLLVLVHHSGKDATKGMRGHSSLFGALDAVLAVQRTDSRREWTSEKVKDGEDGAVFGFRLETVELGHDEDGEPVTSCVVREDREPREIRPPTPKGGNQKIVFDALMPLFRESHHRGKAGAPPTRPCLEVEAVVEAVRDRLTVEPKRRTERVRAALTSLVSIGALKCSEGWLWLP